MAHNDTDPAVLQTLDAQSTIHSSHDGQEHEHEHEHEHHEPKDSAAASTTNDNDHVTEKHTPSDLSETSSIEAEQSIGVTKIEALYIVFGKGWKLAMLWL